MANLLFLVALMPILLLSGMEVQAKSESGLLKQIIAEQKLQMQLQQLNADQELTKMNLMTFELNNIISYVKILVAANTINGSATAK
jgi:hypothetical protein